MLVFLLLCAPTDVSVSKISRKWPSQNLVRAGDSSWTNPSTACGRVPPRMLGHQHIKTTYTNIGCLWVCCVPLKRGTQRRQCWNLTCVNLSHSVNNLTLIFFVKIIIHHMCSLSLSSTAQNMHQQQSPESWSRPVCLSIFVTLKEHAKYSHKNSQIENRQ